MGKNRAETEEIIISGLEAISPGCIDVGLYKQYFAKMSDKAFDEFMQRLKNKEEWITLTVPNKGKNTLSISRNHKLADAWGVTFYHQLWMPSEDDVPGYLTPEKYFVAKLPIRIAAQRLSKKASIPKNQRSVNTLTGQPTGDSKGAGFSAPELKLCVGMGLEKTATELMKYRGGDQRGRMALAASLSRHGKATQETLKHFASGVVSTDTLRSYWTSCHLKSTL